MALKATPQKAATAGLRLEPFDPAHARLVASWVRDDREAFWLAPQTPPPLSAADIRAWRRPGREPLQLVSLLLSAPIGYGELNVLNAETANYWLGHLIVDPLQRGRGVGLELTRALLNRAYGHFGARQVSLVVFPDNAPAIACYHAAGLRNDGYEPHALRPYGRRVRLLRMSVTRSL